ncbi:MAG: potassium transporter [Gammaproteobacteria bacterium]|nr:MAG: potassium transporter [Gammaproteobacteria bacterium]
MENFADIVILLISSVLVVGLFGRMKLPPILAYLYVGLLIGPYGLAFIDDSESVRFLAEFGVVFLLFTIGLEFSLPQLISMKWIVFGLGGAQVVIFTAVVSIIAWLTGFSFAASFIIGGTMAMSSTALVIKQLDDQGELNAAHGKTAVGVLIFQDMAVVPFLILIPIFSSTNQGSMLEPLFFALLKGAAMFLVMLAAGRIIIRPLFHEIALTKSTELFTLTVLLVIIVAAWATHFVDLSLALGAFLAGMMLGETEYRHQIESDIRPFQEVLLGLFFITIGMILDLAVIKELWYWVVPVAFGIILGKIILVAALMRLFSSSKRDALRSGLVLAQGGEFGFALISLALSSNLILINESHVVLAALFLSMIISPFLIRFNGTIVGWFAERGYWGETRRRARSNNNEQITSVAKGMRDHAIVIGFGLYGQNIVRFFEMEGIDYIVLDLDPERVRQARMAGNNVCFGDASRFEILESVNIEKAGLVVVSMTNFNSSIKVIRQIRDTEIEVPICALTKDDTYFGRFESEGVTEIIPESFETSIMLASHCLPFFDVPMSRIIRYSREFRKNRYKQLRGFFYGQHKNKEQVANSAAKQLNTVALGEDGYAVGKRLEELDLRSIEVTVTGIRRRNIRVPDPTGDVELLSNDILVIYGSPENLQKAELFLLTGK